MEELAQRAAEAMAALGDCNEGTWDQRKAELLRAGEHESSGFDEVIAWFQGEEE